MSIEQRQLEAGIRALEARRALLGGGVADASAAGLRTKLSALGVHTGSALLGGGVDAEDGIRGMAVYVAARLEQLAPPGALRISRETWLHVRGLFKMEEQAPLAMKGLQEPVVTFLVKRGLERAWRQLPHDVEERSASRCAAFMHSVPYNRAVAETCPVAKQPFGSTRRAEARGHAVHSLGQRWQVLFHDEPYRRQRPGSHARSGRENQQVHAMGCAPRWP